MPVMSPAHTAPRPAPRPCPSSTVRAVVTTPRGVGAVVAMRGLAPHHVELSTTAMVNPTEAMTPIATMATMASDAQGHGHSSHHQDTPASTHELVAMCAVIILAALTLVTRSTVTTRHTLCSLFRRPEHGSPPDPPVPRLALAFS